MKPLCLPLLLLALGLSSAIAQPIVFAVRHAEKMASLGRDADLSPAGRARADSLAKILKDAGISSIFVSDLHRTQQTAAPLSRILRLEPVIVPANDIVALNAKIRAITDGNILVVGHSDTIPKLIQSLGIAGPMKIDDADYDNLFVVVLGAKPRLVRMHY